MNWYDKKEPKLSEADRDEIRDLYSGYYCEITYFAKLFNVSPSYLMYLLDYRGFKNKQRKSQKKWEEKNIDRVRKMNSKHSMAWQKRNPDRVRQYRASRWERIKNNPVKHKKYKKQNLLATKKYRAKHAHQSR